MNSGDPAGEVSFIETLALQSSYRSDSRPSDRRTDVETFRVRACSVRAASQLKQLESY